MPRMTRAKAAEVADKLHVDEDVVLDLPSELADASMNMKTPEPADRAPLGDIAPNSGGNVEDGELKRSTRGRKGGRKAVKNSKSDLANSIADIADDTPETGSGQQEGADSPDSLTDANESMQDAVGKTEDAGMSEPAQSPVAESMRSEAATKLADTVIHDDAETSQTQCETVPLTAVEAPPSPPPSAMPNVIALLRKDTPGKRSTSNKENVEPMDSPMPSSNTPRRSAVPYDALEQAVVQAATPPGPSRQPSTMELAPVEPAPAAVEAGASEPPASADPIDAMDALEDAVEKVSLEVPNVYSTPEKPKAKKAVPLVRTTKASLARLSMIQAEKTSATTRAPGTGHPRPSTMLGRASSVRQSTANRPEPTSKRIPSTDTKKPDAATQAREKKVVIIPHSKPRPVSLSFPTPPPPPKSKKAPTTSTFQLPGEAVAAKLRAAREERTKNEPEEEQKKPAFKARPVPAGLSKAPSVRQTNASKARESLMGGKPVSATPSSSMTQRRAQSAVTSSTAKPRTVSKDSSSTTAPRTSLRAPLSELRISKRPSTAMANISKPRASTTTVLPTDSSTTSNSMAPPPAPASGQRLPSSSSGKGTAKGKEVFNRAAAAKEAAEREKREKEEASRRARVVAAERGRQASREWAEKRKGRKAAAGAVSGKLEIEQMSPKSGDAVKGVTIEAEGVPA